MKKLSKEQQATLDKHRDALAKAKDEFEAACNAFAEVCQDAGAALADITEGARSYFDDKSEKWQDGDAGMAYSSWLEEMEDLADTLSNTDVSGVVDEAIENVERFDNLPSEPEA